LYVCGKIKNIRSDRPRGCTIDGIADFGDRVFALPGRSIFTESARLKLAKQKSRRDTAFILTLGRPKHRVRPEANLHVEPPLPGKISWSRRRLVYTLIAPPQYVKRSYPALNRTYKI